MLVESFIIEKLMGKRNTSSEEEQEHHEENGGPTKNPSNPYYPGYINHEGQETSEEPDNNRKKIILGILNVILAIIAGYLAWNCNANEKSWIRILNTIIAAVFSGLYMLYYLVYRVILGVSCNGAGKAGTGAKAAPGAQGVQGARGAQGLSRGSSGPGMKTIFD